MKSLRTHFKYTLASLFVVVGFFAYSSLAHAATYTYNNSSGDGDWSNPGNWIEGNIPGSSDDAIIQANVDQVTGDSAYVNSASFIQGGIWDAQCQDNTLTVVTNATFNDSTYNYYCGSISGNAVFLNSSNNYGSVYGSAVFRNLAVNVNYVSGDADFYDNSYIDSNNPGYVGGNATFNGSSHMDSANVSGNAIFKDLSYNSYGTISGTATFVGDSTEFYPGYIGTPPPIRYYNTPASPTRDFATDNGAPWDIVADGVVVNLSGATCNASVIFTPVNGGSFVYGPNCAAGPAGISITSPTANQSLAGWSALVNWNQGVGGYNYASCQYSFGASSHWTPGATDWNVGSPEATAGWHGASCAGNGADIAAPTTYGSQLFVIRAFYNSVATTSLQSFSYTPSRFLYFYNSGSDANWSTVGNWYTNSSHTTPAGSLPTSIDKVTVVGSTVPSVNLDTWTQPALINSGTVGIVFTSASNASTSVMINGKATYNATSRNHGTINGNAIFNTSSSNLGTVQNNATFNNSSTNASVVVGNATFNGDLSSTTGTVSGIKTRYYTATTTTTRNLVGWTVVADGVVVNVTSSTHDATTVFRTLNGGSFIGGPVTVYFWSNGVDTKWSTVSNWYADSGTTTPLGMLPFSTSTVTTLGTVAPTVNIATSSWITPSGIDASKTGITFTASSTTHVNTGITGTVTLAGLIINDGTIAGNATLIGTSSNSSTGVISGSAIFANNSFNNGGAVLGDAIFNNFAYNTAGGTIGGNATFNNTSYNNTNAGAILGTATFNTSAHNDGTIVNDAVFSGNLTENNGTVNGSKTRYWNSSTTTARDFVTTGQWILVADGATVTIATSSVFNATTTFTTLNSGSFVGEGVPGSYTTCLKPLILPGTYTLIGDIPSNLCTIQSAGVTIAGAGHNIGHILAPLPDNASTTAWTNMTGNKLLLHMNDAGIVDTTGGNNMVPSGTLATTTGKLGNAIVFTNGSLTSGSNVGISGSASRTMSAWVKYNSPAPSGWGTYIGWGTGGFGWQWRFSTDSNCGPVKFGIWLYGTPCTGDLQTTVTPVANTWYNIVATYDGTTVKMYINGANVGSKVIALNTTDSPLQIEQRDMVVDEVSIWNRALSSTEVTNQYNSGTGTALVGNESGLVALYHLNESTFTIADTSGNKFNGTFVGGSPIYGVSGSLGTAIKTNTGMQLDISTNAAFDSNVMTVGGLFKFSGSQPYSPETLLGKMNCSSIVGYEMIMSRVTTNKVSFEIANGGGGWDTVTSNTAITDNNWHQIYATVDASHISIYQDGVLTGQIAYGTFVHNPSANLHFGYCSSGYNQYFQGSMDELAYWNRSLSAPEILNIYTSQVSGTLIFGNSYSFNLSNVNTSGGIISIGATLAIANSTVAAIDVSGADAPGNAQAGGTITLTNSTAGALTANGGNSTDYGYGGAAGTISLLSGSTATSQTANAGSNGPNLGAGQQSGGGGGGSSVSGCTDPSASNYNSSANVDNGTCRYASSQVRGCTNPSASNYNPSATVNDGSCSYPSYTTTYVPPGSGGTGDGSSQSNSNSQSNNSNSSNSGGGGTQFTLEQLRALFLKNLPKGGLSSTSATTFGITDFGNPLDNVQALGSLKLTALPKVSFDSYVQTFLFAPLSVAALAEMRKSPQLLASVIQSVPTDQALLNSQKKPVPLVTPKKTPPGLFKVTDAATGKEFPLFVTTSGGSSIDVLARVEPGEKLNIVVLPISASTVQVTLQGKAIPFTPVEISMTASTTPGRYVLSTTASPMSLIIEVVAPVVPPVHSAEKAVTPIAPAKKASSGWFSWIKSLF
ncbi:MAG: LamG-like jellyroll fold domain-containing protein [bacterium]